MTTGALVCIGGILSAASPVADPAITQYGFAGIAVWLVIREAAAAVRYWADRRSRRVNGGCSDHDLLIKLKAELGALRDRVDQMEG